MEIAQLKTFLYIYETGSFTETAKKVFRSQSAVSLQIKALEAELGVKLFERFGPMKVKPTGDGSALAKAAGPLIKDFDRLLTRFNELRGKTQTNEISIASHEAVIAYLLPDIAEQLKRKHKDLKLVFFRKNKDDIISMVREGEADFGITTLDKAPSGIQYKVFRVHKRVLLLPQNHPLSKEKNIKPKQIAAYPLILPPFHSETRTLIDAFFKKRDIPYTVSLELTGRDAVKKYVEKGFGISIMSDYYLEPEDKEKMIITDVSNLFGQTSRGILYRKGKVLSEAQQNFLDLLIKA